MHDAKITVKSGAGLLDARVMWAMRAGAARLALGAQRNVELFFDHSTQISKNIGIADAYVFIAVALPHNAPTKPLGVAFSGSESMGPNSPPFALNDSLIIGGALTPFYQLLCPGEEVYGQIMDPAVASQKIIVVEVTF